MTLILTNVVILYKMFPYYFKKYNFFFSVSTVVCECLVKYSSL